MNKFLVNYKDANNKRSKKGQLKNMLSILNRYINFRVQLYI